MTSMDPIYLPRRYGVELVRGQELSPEHVVDVHIGYYLAGLIDGEGSFIIHASATGFGCTFVMRLRADDRPILESLRAVLGEPGAIRNTVGRAGNQAPCVDWKIAKKRELLWLTELLDVYQLRAKKRHDYAVWREAVIAWNSGAPRDEMVRYREALAEARAYREEALA
jgi:hypothetical protein